MPDELTGSAGLALGTVQWGATYGIANRDGQPAEAEVGRLLARAKAAGVTVLDTARAYGGSEAVIGRLLGSESGWEIFTKLDPMADTADAAADSLRTSRKMLGRPVLDGVLLHRAHQRNADSGAVWNLLRRERDLGCVRRLGVSAGTPDEAWAALDDLDMDCIQVACSLFDQRLSRAGFFAECRRRGRLVFVRSVFLQGAALLNPDQLPPHLRELRGPLAAVGEWAAARGAHKGLAFLAFAAQLPGARILLGCETAVQLDQNLQLWDAVRHAAGDVKSLADEMPALSVQVLNPALWPKTTEGSSFQKTS